ncbi:MAG: hypothetical protein M1833_000544 [Piccolia ochrophora]|nr:MAG: hypothetical protein M1833_000544 [Piccolia ochrophora]
MTLNTATRLNASLNSGSDPSQKKIVVCDAAQATINVKRNYFENEPSKSLQIAPTPAITSS